MEKMDPIHYSSSCSSGLSVEWHDVCPKDHVTVNIRSLRKIYSNLKVPTRYYSNQIITHPCQQSEINVPRGTHCIWLHCKRIVQNFGSKCFFYKKYFQTENFVSMVKEKAFLPSQATKDYRTIFACASQGWPRLAHLRKMFYLCGALLFVSALYFSACLVDTLAKMFVYMKMYTCRHG